MPKLMVCCLLMAALTGCASSAGYMDAPLEVYAEKDATPEASTARAGLSGDFVEAPLEDAELRITRDGWIRVDCGEEMAASNRLRKAAAKFEAVVMSFNDHSVSFKMPSSRLESLLEVIEGTEGWEIDEFDFSAWDRTGEYFSIEARIESTQAIKQRMLKLLESAQTVDEVLLIGQKIDGVQAQLDGFETSLRDIKLHAGRVDVTVSFD